MTDEQLEERFQEIKDLFYELDGEKRRLEYKIEDLESLCSRLEDKITEIGWRT